MQDAKEFVVTDEIRHELKKIAEDLRSGKIKHVQSPATEFETEIPRFFNMNYWHKQFTCGTAMCIGGWLEQRTGEGINDFIPSGLNELFYPNGEIADDYCLITPEQAADAIDNYLEYGKPYWGVVLR